MHPLPGKGGGSALWEVALKVVRAHTCDGTGRRAVGAGGRREASGAGGKGPAERGGDRAAITVRAAARTVSLTPVHAQASVGRVRSKPPSTLGHGGVDMAPLDPLAGLGPTPDEGDGCLRRVGLKPDTAVQLRLFHRALAESLRFGR